VTEPAPSVTSRTAALRYPDFRYYQAGRFSALIGTQIQSVAIGWQVYSFTGRPLDLGWVGLAQFLPAFFLFPLTGYAADRFERRGILTLCHGAFALSAFLFYLLAERGVTDVTTIYAILVLVGAARGFAGPAGHALVPNLVMRKDVPSAIGWGSSIFELSRLIGPAIGGLLFTAGGAKSAFMTTACLECASVILLLLVRTRSRGGSGAVTSLSSVGAGMKYLLQNRILLGAVSLDLFAVLLGGAIALAPIFARDVLEGGPMALGLLRSAPAIGASLMGLWLAQRAPTRHMGRWMFACVFLFGVATVVFGASKSLPLSLGALAVAGAADMVSVYVRHLLVQLATPDAMRGRVAAVNLVFIGASNELGEFESGLTAEWFGAVRAAVLGGVGTCLVVLLWAALFPELRRVDRLDREVA
jgi:predicted MFS family arabinose efflux permease